MRWPFSKKRMIEKKLCTDSVKRGGWIEQCGAVLLPNDGLCANRRYHVYDQDRGTEPTWW